MIDLPSWLSPSSSASNETPNNIDEEEVITTDESVVEFVCEPELYNAIPEPKPANNVLPRWYEQLDGSLGEGLGESSVKRCAPFLDAMTSGWIIPLAGEVEVSVDSDEGEMDISWNLDRKVIGKHHQGQVAGSKFPLDKPIMKFNNYWSIKVPEGYSVLFTKPFNRIETRFKVFSGVVDCDKYFNTINFPALWLDLDVGTVVLESGMPVVQAIPFKRDAMVSDARARPMSDKEIMAFRRQQNSLQVEESDYRNNRWQPKTGTRMVD